MRHDWPKVLVPVLGAQVGLLGGQVEQFAGLAEHQVVGLLLALVQLGELLVARHGVRQGVHFVQQVAPRPLALVGDALGDDALHHETPRRRVAAGGEGPVARPQEARLVEAPRGRVSTM